jgi:hypothetical protein
VFEFRAGFLGPGQHLWINDHSRVELMLIVSFDALETGFDQLTAAKFAGTHGAMNVSDCRLIVQMKILLTANYSAYYS